MNNQENNLQTYKLNSVKTILTFIFSSLVIIGLTLGSILTIVFGPKFYYEDHLRYKEVEVSVSNVTKYFSIIDQLNIKEGSSSELTEVKLNIYFQPDNQYIYPRGDITFNYTVTISYKKLVGTTPSEPTVETITLKGSYYNRDEMRSISYTYELNSPYSRIDTSKQDIRLIGVNATIRILV
jgi:hypothetical protein